MNPKTLSYAITSLWPTCADGVQAEHGLRRILEESIFAELIIALENSSNIEKFFANLINTGKPRLRIITNPERRPYCNILAFPIAATPKELS